MAGGIEVVDPPEEIPSGEEFLRKLPERARWVEETAFITDIFKHAAQAHEHLLEVCANVAALAKITDKNDLDDSHTWCGMAFGAVECSRGILESPRRQKGRDIRRGKERKGKEDSAARPRCHLPKTRAT